MDIAVNLLNFNKPMRKLLFLLLLSSIGLLAQNQKIRFDYDTAGNQIVREFCSNCLSKTETKNLEELKDNELMKFNPDDSFSYYPNPVKEELYLKWDSSKETKISSIALFGLNGALLKSFDQQENLMSQSIYFEKYPSGMYFIVLTYTNGEEKSIKIIKQ